MTSPPTRIAVVAGAGGGMGAAITRDLARDHRVIALARNLDALRAELGHLSSVECRRLDLLDFAAYEPVLAHVERVDVVVHAAAVAERYSVETSSPAEWQRQFAVNVVAPAELTRVLLPRLRASSGQVIFLNSGAGQRVVPFSTVYSATKFALHAVADGLRAEEQATRIRVATVSPGPTDTTMLHSYVAARGEEYEPDRYIEPMSVARAVRLVVDTGADAQITQVSVRPRVELG